MQCNESSYNLLNDEMNIFAYHTFSLCLCKDLFVKLILQIGLWPLQFVYSVYSTISDIFNGKGGLGLSENGQH